MPALLRSTSQHHHARERELKADARGVHSLNPGLRSAVETPSFASLGADRTPSSASIPPVKQSREQRHWGCRDPCTRPNPDPRNNLHCSPK